MLIGESDCINVLEKRKDVPLAIKTDISRNLAFVLSNAATPVISLYSHYDYTTHNALIQEKQQEVTP